MKKLLNEIKPDFSWINSKPNWRNEIWGGFVGAILVIPQGVTFAYLAGVPPEHGIYCAIFVTFFASLFGNSIMMSGPNTGVSILIGLAVLPLAGRSSPLFIDYVMILSFMVGVVQLAIWLLRAGQMFMYITPASISGITMGIGCLIMLSSLDGLMGLTPIKANFFFEKIIIIFQSFDELVNIYSLSIGLITIFFGFLFKYKFNRYYIIFAIIAGTIAGIIVNGVTPQNLTNIEFLGKIHLHLWSIKWPKLNNEYFVSSIQLIPAAFAIAFLGLSQSLIIARDQKFRINPEIDLNKEVFAQGISNFFAPFTQSFCGSGSFNRTQVNEELHVRTPLGGLVTSLSVALIVFTIGPFFMYLPLSVISGILFIVGFNMIKPKKILEFKKNRIEFMSFCTTILTVLFIGLMPAVVISIAFSLFQSLEKFPGQKIKSSEKNSHLRV